MNRVEIVGKIGSMALVRRDVSDIDYNILSQVASELRPGMIWVTSGAAEIGRLDYLRRAGQALVGDASHVKADYCAQGQSILMDNYRRFAHAEYSLRQVLVEHQHFNDPVKRENLKGLFLRAAQQNAIPIVNYNDAISDEELRKMELHSLRERQQDVVECVDNDETAAVISELVNARYLLILTTTEGIYSDPKDPSTLVRDVFRPDVASLTEAVRALQDRCVGASRPGANGARAKLDFSLRAARSGKTVVIGHARHGIDALLSGAVDCTRIGLRP